MGDKQFRGFCLVRRSKVIPFTGGNWGKLPFHTPRIFFWHLTLQSSKQQTSAYQNFIRIRNMHVKSYIFPMQCHSILLFICFICQRCCKDHWEDLAKIRTAVLEIPFCAFISLKRSYPSSALVRGMILSVINLGNSASR